MPAKRGLIATQQRRRGAVSLKKRLGNGIGRRRRGEPRRLKIKAMKKRGYKRKPSRSLYLYGIHMNKVASQTEKKSSRTTITQQ